MGRIDSRTIRQILSLLVLVWTGGWCTAPVGAKSLAVLEFAGPGIPRVDLAEVSARLGRSLAATGRFRFVAADSTHGRPGVDSAASPGGRGTPDGKGSRRVETQWNRSVCIDGECAIQAGVLRKVDRVVTGMLARRGSEWVLTTRMWDVATSSPLLKYEYRTEKGLLDLMDRGVVVVASRYDFAEIRLESILAKKRPGEVGNFRDTAQEAKLEHHLRQWRTVAAVTGGLALGALYGGAWLQNRALDNCPEPRGATCRDPHRDLELGLLGASAALGAVAAASIVVVVRDTKQLQALKEKSLLDISWTPLWDPRTEAVGLATRLDF